MILQTLLALSYEHLYCVRTLTDYLHRPAPGSIAHGTLNADKTFRDLETALLEIRIHELPRPSDVSLALLFRRVARRTAPDIAEVAQIFDQIGRPDQDYRSAEQLLNSVRDTAIWLVGELSKAITEYGATPMQPPEHLVQLRVKARMVPHNLND